MDAGPLELIRPGKKNGPESFSSVIRDGASCKNPLDLRARDRRAFLALGERIS